MASPYIEADHVQPNQGTPEGPANAATDKLDRKINQRVAKAITGSDTFTEAEVQENHLIELTGTPGAPFNIDMHANTTQIVQEVLNSTDDVATIRNDLGGGTGQPVIGIGEIQRFRYDGTNFISLAPAAGAGSTFLALTDAPASYASQTLKPLRVNAGETALEFGDPAFSAGAEGTPSIGFTGDPNTGFWAPTGDVMALSVNASEAWRTDASGRLLIGDTISRALWSGVNPSLQINGTAQDDSSATLQRFSADANAPAIVFAKSRSASLGGFTIVVDDDVVGQIVGTAADGVDMDVVPCEIRFLIDDASPAAGAIGGEIKFLTSTTAGALNENMAIRAGGVVFMSQKLMVGTVSVSPDGTLHAHTATAGSVTANTIADDLIVENNGDAGISILTPDANIGYLVFGNPVDDRAADLSWDLTSDELTLATRNAGADIVLASADGVEALRVFSNQDIRLSAGVSALATSATGGFPGMPTMAGDASGTPTNESAGFAPFAYDTTNQEIKLYDPVANAWRTVATAAQ